VDSPGQLVPRNPRLTDSIPLGLKASVPDAQALGATPGCARGRTRSGASAAGERPERAVNPPWLLAPRTHARSWSRSVRRASCGQCGTIRLPFQHRRIADDTAGDIFEACRGHAFSQLRLEVVHLQSVDVHAFKGGPEIIACQAEVEVRPFQIPDVPREQPVGGRASVSPHFFNY